MMMNGMVSVIQSLLSSSSFSPSGNNSMQAFVAGGSKSALIINTIARSGVKDEKSKKLLEIFGEVVSALKLEDKLELSFFTDLKPVANQKGYDYYYFYIADKQYTPGNSTYDLGVTPYFFRVKESDYSFQTLNAGLFDKILPHVSMRYENVLGHTFDLAENEVNINKNSLNYPVSNFNLGVQSCIHHLDLGSEMASSKLFSARSGNYIYSASIIQ